MLCETCGTSASGIYCPTCGAVLSDSANRQTRPLKRLLSDPRVKALIEDELAYSTKPGSATDWLKAVDKLLSRSLGTRFPVPLDVCGRWGSEMWSRLGFKVQRLRRYTYQRQFGQVIIASLRYVARNGMEVRLMAEAESLCLVEAIIPSNWLSWEGRLRLAIKDDGSDASMCAEVEFPGQFFDWGRGSKLLDTMFVSIESKIPDLPM